MSMAVPAISTRSNLLDEPHSLPPGQGLFHGYHPVLRAWWLAHYTRNKLFVTALLKIRPGSCRYLSLPAPTILSGPTPLMHVEDELMPEVSRVSDAQAITSG